MLDRFSGTMVTTVSFRSAMALFKKDKRDDNYGYEEYSLDRVDWKYKERFSTYSTIGANVP